MLHREMMFRFGETDRVLHPPRDSDEAPTASWRPRWVARARLAVSVFGNVLVGAALLCGLLLAPQLLARLLGM